MVDRAATPRFKPLLGSGTASLAEGVWTGRFAATDPKQNALGETTFTHTMATGTGTAHINAPKITFCPEWPAARRSVAAAGGATPGRRQRRAYRRYRLDARGHHQPGKLTILSLDFMTPLGKAHAVKSDIALTSLLPPITAPGQGLTISRIDWTLPFSAVDVRFGFSPTMVELTKAETDIAEGHASLGAITISLANPGRIRRAPRRSRASNSILWSQRQI
jgi:hypothetical protein